MAIAIQALGFSFLACNFEVQNFNYTNSLYEALAPENLCLTPLLVILVTSCGAIAPNQHPCVNGGEGTKKRYNIMLQNKFSCILIMQYC